MTVLCGFFDSLKNLFILFAGNLPIAAQKSIGEHRTFFFGIFKRLDICKNGAIFFFETGLVVFELPQLERLDLTHDAGNEAFVFVVCFLHNSVTLSQLFSPLRKAPLDSPDGNGQHLRYFRDGLSLEIMQADGFPYFFAEQAYRLTDVFKLVFGKKLILFRRLKAVKRVKADVRNCRAIMPFKRSCAVFRKRTDPRAEF